MLEEAKVVTPPLRSSSLFDYLFLPSSHRHRVSQFLPFLTLFFSFLVLGSTEEIVKIAYVY